MKWPEPTPPWITEALRHRGLREGPGKQNNPVILGWIKKLGGWFNDDETPWCGTFVAHCLDQAGFPVPKDWFRAKSYVTYGDPCTGDNIPFGAICVKGRVGGGHVFFAVGRSPGGETVYGLGGNQSNMVNIAAFKVSDLIGIRYPNSKSVLRDPLPIIASAAAVNATMGGSEA